MKLTITGLYLSLLLVLSQHAWSDVPMPYSHDVKNCTIINNFSNFPEVIFINASFESSGLGDLFSLGMMEAVENECIHSVQIYKHAESYMFAISRSNYNKYLKDYLNNDIEHNRLLGLNQIMVKDDKVKDYFDLALKLKSSAGDLRYISKLETSSYEVWDSNPLVSEKKIHQIIKNKEGKLSLFLVNKSFAYEHYEQTKEDKKEMQHLKQEINSLAR